MCSTNSLKVARLSPGRVRRNHMPEQSAKRTGAAEKSIGVLREGERNDGLTRLGGAMRRRGAELAELETGLLEANDRRCQPPLPTEEVLKVAASVARYPVGGPDPLESAWRTVEVETYSSNYERF